MCVEQCEFDDDAVLAKVRAAQECVWQHVAKGGALDCNEDGHCEPVTKCKKVTPEPAYSCFTDCSTECSATLAEWDIGGCHNACEQACDSLLEPSSVKLVDSDLDPEADADAAAAAARAATSRGSAAAEKKTSFL